MFKDGIRLYVVAPMSLMALVAFVEGAEVVGFILSVFAVKFFADTVD